MMNIHSEIKSIRINHTSKFFITVKNSSHILTDFTMQIALKYISGIIHQHAVDEFKSDQITQIN